MDPQKIQRICLEYAFVLAAYGEDSRQANDLTQECASEPDLFVPMTNVVLYYREWKETEMAAKKLDPAAKAAIAQCGITLTPTQENIAALASINWQQLLADLGAMAKVVIPIILAILGINNPPPTPPAPQALKSGQTCDHHACCCEVLQSALDTAAKAADHCLACCDGCY